MMPGIPAGELAWLALAIVFGGALTGLLAGLFGVGGGAVIVPVLYEIFRVIGVSDDVRVQLCVGTSLAVIIPTSIRSFLAHRAKGTLPVSILKAWIVPVALGVIVGGLLAAVAPTSVFKSFFAVMAFLVGAKFLFAKASWRISDTMPGAALMWVYGLFIGFYSAMMGVGGGAVSTLVLSLYGQPIHAAVGISAGVGVVISIIGTIGFVIAGLPYQSLMPPLSIGYVSLVGFVLMGPISAFFAPYGARIAHAMSRRKLELAFGIFLWFVAARFVLSLVW
jgi:uncharacterized membrane protein YfcA